MEGPRETAPVSGESGEAAEGPSALPSLSAAKPYNPFLTNSTEFLF